MSVCLHNSQHYCKFNNVHTTCKLHVLLLTHKCERQTCPLDLCRSLFLFKNSDFGDEISTPHNRETRTEDSSYDQSTPRHQHPTTARHSAEQATTTVSRNIDSPHMTHQTHLRVYLVIYVDTVSSSTHCYLRVPYEVLPTYYNLRHCVLFST